MENELRIAREIIAELVQSCDGVEFADASDVELAEEIIVRHIQQQAQPTA